MPEGTHASIDSGKGSKSNKKVERVTIRLTGELGEGLKELEEVTTASSPSDVVRRAILVYYKLVKHKLEGDEPVVLLNEDNKKLPIFL